MLSALLLSFAVTVLPDDDVAAPADPAKDLLERAAAAQHADGVAGDLKDFSVKLFLTRRDEEGSRIDLDVERKYKAPDMLWTRIVEKAISDSVFQQGYDGETAWMLDEKDGKPILLEGPEYRTDRRKIETDLKTMRQLLRFFFLRNLIPAMSNVEVLPDEARDGLETSVVRGEGRFPETEDEDCVVTLWIEKGTHRLLEARLEVEGKAPMQFRFRRHGKNAQGVVVPGETKIFHADEELPSEVLIIQGFVTEDGKHQNDIWFNKGIPDQTFRPPA